MSARKRKSVEILILAAVVTLSGWIYSGQKDRALSAAYSGVQYTRIAAESCLFLWHIEELIRFVEEAELDETMEKLRMISSYMEGVCVTSKNFDGFVASAGNPGTIDSLPDPLVAPDRGGWRFLRQDAAAWIILSSPIQSVGMDYLYVKVDGAAIDAASADVRREAGWRTLVLFVEVGLAAALLVAARKKNSGRWILRGVVLVTLTVSLACGADTTLELARLKPDLSSMTKQSAQRVVQILELQRSWARSGDPGYLYQEDLSGFLRRVEQNMPFLESLYPGEEDVLQAEYATRFVTQNLRRTALAMLSPFHPITSWMPIEPIEPTGSTELMELMELMEGETMR